MRRLRIGNIIRLDEPITKNNKTAVRGEILEVVQDQVRVNLYTNQAESMGATWVQADDTEIKGGLWTGEVLAQAQLSRYRLISAPIKYLLCRYRDGRQMRYDKRDVENLIVRMQRYRILSDYHKQSDKKRKEPRKGTGRGGRGIRLTDVPDGNEKDLHCKYCGAVAIRIDHKTVCEQGHVL